MSIRQIDSEKAKELLDQNPDAIYIDVRSIPEFARGHPANAINIPLFHKDESIQRLVPNEDFIRVTARTIPKEKILIIGCQSGGRSQRACDLLDQFGYQKLHNLQGGFGGIPGIPGWEELNFPISQENGEGVSYDFFFNKTIESTLNK